QSFDMLEAADSVEVSKMVESGLVDIGLVRDVIPFPNLESKKIFHEKLFFIVGKGHPLAAKTEIKKEDLMNQTMICYRRESALWQKIDEKLVGVKDLKRIEVGGFEMLLSMVKNNWGFCIVPELILSKSTKNDFSIIPFPDFKDLTYNIIGVYKKDFPKYEKLHLLLQSFESTLKELQNHLNV
ncbi:MAG: LysR family transcriptional regulator substrate-binding protein, partial [Bacillota bacterium]|nr:LysR family transcriptional regulator substrate-binding protein [Bacillota bacterium]